jgi:hypothetical protein
MTSSKAQPDQSITRFNIARRKPISLENAGNGGLLLGLSASPSVPFVPVISATFAMPAKAPQGSHKHWQRE